MGLRIVPRLDPLVRRSLGSFRREPVWSLVIVMAVAVFALARGTASLVTDAAANRAFTAEVQSAATSAGAGLGLDARAYTTGLDSETAERAVSQLLDALPVYGTPLLSVSPLLPYSGPDHPTPVIRTSGGASAAAVVFSIGDATASLHPASGTGAASTGGVWVPDTLATGLGIRVGDRVSLRLDWPSWVDKPAEVDEAATTVVGVYATQAGLPTSEAFDWRSPPAPLPLDPAGRAGPPALLLADAGTAMSLIAAMDDTAFVRWDLRWTGAASIDRGRDAATAVEQAARALLDTETPATRQVVDAHGQRVMLSSGVPTFVQRSSDSAAALRPVVASIAVTGQVMALLVVAMSVWVLGRARRREHELSLAAGASPIRVGATATAGQLVPIVAGVAVAYVAVRWLPGLVAGGGVGRVAVLRATRQVVWALPLAACALAATALASVWSLDAVASGRAGRLMAVARAETIVVVAALATGAPLLSRRGSVLDEGTSLLFPLLAVLAGSVVVVRGVAATARAVGARRNRAVRRAARSGRPRYLAVWLARRRLSHSLTELGALVIVVASGVGLFVYCASVSRVGVRGVRDKAAAMGAASATAEIARSRDVPHGGDGYPTGLPPGDAVVWWYNAAETAPGVQVDLLAVDPATFPAAVSWRRSFGGPSLDSLLADIAGSEPPVVDAVVAGDYADTVPDHGLARLEFGHAPVPYRVVARIAAAPWQRKYSTVMVVAARALAPQLDPVPAPTPPDVDNGPNRLDRMMRTYVWSRGSQHDLESFLGPRALPSDVPNVGIAARLPSFVAFDLAMPYLTLVGTALLAVSCAAIVILNARRRQDLALEVALTDKMGLPARTAAGAIIGGGVLVGLVSSLLGVGLAALLVRVMVPRLDPETRLPPYFAGTVSVGIALAAVAAVVAVSALSASWELRQAHRARVAEVLRGAE